MPGHAEPDLHGTHQPAPEIAPSDMPKGNEQPNVDNHATSKQATVVSKHSITLWQARAAPGRPLIWSCQKDCAKLLAFQTSTPQPSTAPSPSGYTESSACPAVARKCLLHFIWVKLLWKQKASMSLLDTVNEWLAAMLISFVP